jgi:CubicO group peptidase (beta-lactamase class C family)
LLSSLLRDALGTWGTGIVARVEHRGNLVYEEAFGATRADELAQPVYVDTRFDLASITKLFVSTIALALVDAGRLDLDAVVLERGITLRMLLAHTSGMNSGADYRTLFDLNVEQFALTRDLVAQPGERVIYSDLGMIALGHVIETTLRCSLSHAMRLHFPTETLGFAPSAAQQLAIPATEEEAWRGRVQGVVHDEKAYLMNGVAGHAGLFGTARDVAALANVYLAAARGRAQSLLSETLATQAIAEQAYDPVLRRGLGWALKTTDQNSCGRLLSMETFGHTGFTGTCVWADPERDLCGVLLTNSVYFGRNDSWPIRAAFFEAIVELA